MNLLLAHDYLIQMGGAERVVAAMHGRFPEAPIYTSAVRRKGLWEEFRDAEIRTSWMQHLPLIGHHTHFKKYFPLYPLAFRSFGELDADAAWISSSTFAKYLCFSPRTRTVCYLHNTTRFLWQTDDYLDYEIGFRPLNAAVRKVLPWLRERDRLAAAKMKVVVTNSRNVQERVRRCYGLESLVVHPPVDTSRFAVCREDEGYYLVVSRLLGYKNIDLAVRALGRTGRRLLVLGEGPFRSRLEAGAAASVQFLGRVSDREIGEKYAKCRALILPGEEDFGITPVEAMACGKPVIALGRGGALESVLDGTTGIFFREPTEDSLLDAVERCESASWDQAAIRSHALGFSKEVFVERMAALLGEL